MRPKIAKCVLCGADNRTNTDRVYIERVDDVRKRRVAVCSKCIVLMIGSMEDGLLTARRRTT